MKPTVTLLTGRHITAADKRAIVEGIEYLRQDFAPYIEAAPEIAPAYGKAMLRRGKSPKGYQIAPEPDAPGVYYVTITTNETTDAGRPQQRVARVSVEVKGIAPLYLPQQRGQLALAL